LVFLVKYFPLKTVPYTYVIKVENLPDKLDCFVQPHVLMYIAFNLLGVDGSIPSVLSEILRVIKMESFNNLISN
jgi:hypothetical protein